MSPGSSGFAAPLLAALLLLACAGPRPLAVPPGEIARVDFSPDRDSFAFPNEVRALHPGAADLYANYCFVLAKGVRQFFVAARFDPTSPPLDHAGYVDRVRAIADRPPWEPPLPEESRVVIPGYANLHEFSAAQEAAVKEGLGDRFWTLVHWTNWRVTFPVTTDQQEATARELMEEIRTNRLAQMLVTRFPTSELNHTVVAYAYEATPEGVDFTVWDPNDPEHPGVVGFDRATRRFLAKRFFAVEPGPIRAFRVYYSSLL